MRHTKTNIAIAIAAAGAIMSGSAVAAPALDALFPGSANLISDDYAEILINAGPVQSASPTVIDPGDLLVGVLSFSTVTNLSGPGNNVIGACCNEFTGVFAQSYVGDSSVVGSPIGILDLFTGTSVFAPLSAAERLVAGAISPTLAAVLGSWAPGTIVSAYDDPANDFARSGGTLDALFASAAGGTLLFEAGFTGAPGEYFMANLPSLDIAFLALGTPTNPLATLASGLNLTNNPSGLEVLKTECIFVGSGVFNDVCAGGSIYGVGGTPTPFNLFGDLNAEIFLVPEPTTTPLVLLGGTMIGLGLAARRRREA